MSKKDLISTIGQAAFAVRRALSVDPYNSDAHIYPDTYRKVLNDDEQAVKVPHEKPDTPYYQRSSRNISRFTFDVSVKPGKLREGEGYYFQTSQLSDELLAISQNQNWHVPPVHASEVDPSQVLYGTNAQADDTQKK